MPFSPFYFFYSFIFYHCLLKQSVYSMKREINPVWLRVGLFPFVFCLIGQVHPWNSSNTLCHHRVGGKMIHTAAYEVLHCCTKLQCWNIGLVLPDDRFQCVKYRLWPQRTSEQNLQAFLYLKGFHNGSVWLTAYFNSTRMLLKKKPTFIFNYIILIVQPLFPLKMKHFSCLT